MNIFISFLILCLGCMANVCAKPKYKGLEADCDLAIDKYATDLAKRTGMEFLFVGDATDGKYVVFCMALRRFPQENLNEARVLSANLVEEFWQMLLACPAVSDYIKNVKSAVRKTHPSTVTLDRLGYKIGYWDKDINRPKSPFIAEILFESGIFYYYEAEPETQKLKLVLKESYEDTIAYRNSLKNSSNNDSMKDSP